MAIPPGIPLSFWLVTAFVFGVCIGSFLNVVIYRLPKEQSLLDPSSSYCPNCGHSLSLLDLVPLFSYLALGRKCRYCKTPISPRYFSVELLTGIVFVFLTARYSTNGMDCLTVLLFVSALIPIYFIDLATFTIPISLTLIATLIPYGRDFYGIAVHDPGFELMFGWLPRSIFGGIVGAGAFGAVRILGWVWKRQEAMGLGDVLLARGMGAMLAIFVPFGAHPLRYFPVWVLACCLSGAVAGPLMIWLRRRTLAAAAEVLGSESLGGLDAGAEYEEEPSSFGRQLLEVGEVLWYRDALDYLLYTFRDRKKLSEAERVPEADLFVPAPSAIPFGPFLVLGFLVTLFWGEWATAAYLLYTFGPK